MPSIALASRSVKKCQNSTVPVGSAAGAATAGALVPGVQPAARMTAARAAPAYKPARKNHVLLLGQSGGLRGIGAAE